MLNIDPCVQGTLEIAFSDFGHHATSKYLHTLFGTLRWAIKDASPKKTLHVYLVDLVHRVLLITTENNVLLFYGLLKWA